MTGTPQSCLPRGLAVLLGGLSLSGAGGQGTMGMGQQSQQGCGHENKGRPSALSPHSGPAPPTPRLLCSAPEGDHRGLCGGSRWQGVTDGEDEAEDKERVFY